MFDKPVRALLIEDSAVDARLAATRLPSEAARWVRVERVATLRSGLAQLKESLFDVVILDLDLPDSQGLRTLERVHAAAKDTPIVVLGGDEDGRLAAAAVRMGAQDFLPKSEIGRDSLLRSIQFAIERSGRRRAEHKLRDKEEQFLLAQAIQRRLFPDAAPRLDDFDLAGAVYPATETCGDYLDFIRISPQVVAAVVGDVSGHGVGPALLMAETRAYLRALVESHTDPGEILTQANRLLSGDVGDEHFVSLFVARLDATSGTLICAGAGHAAHHFDAVGVTSKIGSTGLVLGLVRETRIESSPPIVLQKGELMLLMTDGLVEMQNPGGELLGIERALSVVRAVRDRPAQKIIEHLYHAARAFAGDRPQEDDIAVIVIKREG